jgi:hypothetical protein
MVMKSTTLLWLAVLANDLNDNELATVIWLITLQLCNEPNATLPRIEIPEPILANCLIETEEPKFKKSRILLADFPSLPPRVKALIDSELPREIVAITDEDEPHLAKLLNDILEPILKKSSTLIAEPALAKDLKLKLLLTSTWLIIDVFPILPKETAPKTDNPEPILANFLKLKEEPKVRKSTTEAAEPHLPNALTDIEEPTAVKSPILTVPPNRLLNPLILQEEPKFIICITLSFPPNLLWNALIDIELPTCK